jgi:hypothetical protein
MRLPQCSSENIAWNVLAKQCVLLSRRLIFGRCPVNRLEQSGNDQCRDGHRHIVERLMRPQGSIPRYASWNRVKSVAIATLVTLILAPATTAEARHRHHHHFEYQQGSPEQEYGLPASNRPAGRRGLSLAQLLPRDWKLQPPDSNWTGK